MTQKIVWTLSAACRIEAVEVRENSYTRRTQLDECVGRCCATGRVVYGYTSLKAAELAGLKQIRNAELHATLIQLNAKKHRATLERSICAASELGAATHDADTPA